MTTILNSSLVNHLARLVELLYSEADPVRRQQLIELLILHHAKGMGNRADALTVADGINKHAKQLIDQQFAVRQ